MSLAYSRFCSCERLPRRGAILPIEAGTAGGRKGYPFTVLDGQSHRQQQLPILAGNGASQIPFQGSKRIDLARTERSVRVAIHNHLPLDRYGKLQACSGQFNIEQPGASLRPTVEPPPVGSARSAPLTDSTEHSVPRLPERPCAPVPFGQQCETLASSRAEIERGNMLLKASTPPDGPRSSRTWSKRRSSLAILGARRASMTVALHMLEGKQALRRERSRIRILNNEKLALAAGPYST
jgi:hypothetical protein